MWGLLKEAAHREQYLLGSLVSTSVLGDDVDTGGSGGAALPSWAGLLTVSSAGDVSERLSRTATTYISVKCDFTTVFISQTHT